MNTSESPAKKNPSPLCKALAVEFYGAPYGLKVGCFHLSPFRQGWHCSRFFFQKQYTIVYQPNIPMDTWFHGHLSDEKDEKPEDFGAPHLAAPLRSLLKLPACSQVLRAVGCLAVGGILRRVGH